MNEWLTDVRQSTESTDIQEIKKNMVQNILRDANNQSTPNWIA